MMPLPPPPNAPPFQRYILTGGSFQDSAGNPLSNGSLVWTLSHDSNISVLGSTTGTQVVSGVPIRVYLDQIGNISSSGLAQQKNQFLWPNDQLTPSGSYYTVMAYDYNGIEVWTSPQFFTIGGLGTGAFGVAINIGSLIPLQP